MEIIHLVKEKEMSLLKQIEEINKELTIVQVVKEYLEMNFSNKMAHELFYDYMKNIEAYCNWTKLESNGFKVDPNEALMRSIEEKVGISENAKKAFREEILIRASATSRKGKVFDYTSHYQLREAIEKCL